MRQEFKQRLRVLYTTYKTVLPENILIVFYNDRHLDIYIKQPPTVIHDCWGYLAVVTTNRKEIVTGGRKQ